MKNLSIAFLLCVVFVSVTMHHPVSAQTLPPVETVDAATRTRWLVDGVIVDAMTGQPVKEAIVTPGTLSVSSEGRTTIRWRDQLKLEMKPGSFQWPRTSGFSIMRFRVTAPGYHPAITQKIRRGGPHIRMKVKLRSIVTDSK